MGAVVENIENCPNFAYVFEMIFKCDHEKLEEFKKKHIKEGEFTDLDGVMTLATAYYLGVTLRIFSRTNSKKNPYTGHNPNQLIIFNVFLDDRSSGHFQSLLQPDRSTEEAMQDWYDRFVNTEQEVYKPKLQISVGRLENSEKNKKPTETKDNVNDKTNPDKKTNDLKSEEITKIKPEKQADSGSSTKCSSEKKQANSGNSAKCKEIISEKNQANSGNSTKCNSEKKQADFGSSTKCSSEKE